MASDGRDVPSDDVDLEDFSLLVERQTEALNALQMDLEELDKRRNEYNTVKERLKDVSSKLAYPTMVPLSKVAFIPGELIHTNEVLVLLGDGYFVETTAPKASEIADKRLNLIAERRKEVDEAIKRQKNEVESTKKFVHENNSGPVREVFEQLPDDNDSLAFRDANSNRVSKVKNNQDKAAVLASLKEKQERIRKGVKKFEEERPSTSSSSQNMHTEKQASSQKESIPEPELEKTDNPTSAITTLGSSIDKDAILKRVEKLMRESKELDQLDREDSEDSDDNDDEEIEATRDNIDNVVVENNELDNNVKVSEKADAKSNDNRRVSFSKEIAVREISPKGNRRDESVESASTSEIERNTSQPKSFETSTAVEDLIIERNSTSQEIENVQSCQNAEEKSTKPVSLFKKNRKR